MSNNPQDALEIARRIADGETMDLSKLEADDPALARGLRKLGALARAMQTGAPVGESWGHLQQLQLAGQGGFGEVYRAYDPTLDRTVALKLKRDNDSDLLASGRDFVAEARRLARVRHPHVLAVHGASYHDGRAGLWSDWIDGETLATRLHRGGPLRGELLLRVLSELAAAIEAVHGAGLVHGDIKASNVMLDSGGHVILMDFGAGFESSDEGTSISAGTPRYLAPEIIAGKPATLAVDLYAFGVLTHLIASDRFPGDGDAISAQINPGLRRLIARLLDREPLARPRAAELRQSLRQLIEAPEQRVRQWLLASIVIGLLAVILVTVVGLRREQIERQHAERARDEAAATAEFLTEVLAAPAPEMQGREVRVVDVLDAAVRRAQSEPGLSPQTRASLLYTVGRSQLALNRFRAADTTLTEALALDRPEHALAPTLALQIGLRVVEARSRRENHAEAAQALTALEQDPRWRGNTNASVEIAIARADALNDQNKRAEALGLLDGILQNEAALPAPIRIAALHMRARVQFEERDMTAAEASLRAALELLQQSDARSGLLEFELRTLLANACIEQGRLEEAEKIYRALAIFATEAYGENSIGARMAAANVAMVIANQGRYAEAEGLLRALIPRAEAASGKDSAQVLGMRSNLAAALYQGGKIEEALAEYSVLIALDEQHFGATNPQTLIDRFNRVEALNSAERHAEALQEGEVLHATMLSAVGAEHPFTLETEDAIGYALTKLGRAKEAVPMHRRTLALKTAALTADSPYTLLSREYLARALIALGQFEQARSELMTLRADRERVLGKVHPKTLVAEQLLEALEVLQRPVAERPHSESIRY